MRCVSGGTTMIRLKHLLTHVSSTAWQCVDSLVFHFIRYAAMVREVQGSGPRSLPVLFHQCMLAFAERYKNDITEDQREALLDLLLSHGHDQIAPEIRRQLLAGRGRGVPLEEGGPAFDGDDTMQMD
jgi:essential nuclear protein 1